MIALHQHLNGVEGAQPPDEWVLGQIADAFGCPLVAGGAVEQPIALALDIMELRAYARAKAELEAAKDESDVAVTPSIEMVWRVQHELLRRRRARAAT